MTQPADARRIDGAVIGGSGLYDLAGIDGVEDVTIDTPYGAPSDAFRIGTVGGKRVAFLARHGRGHRLLPTEINFRANIWALKKLGADWILSASAVGSMKERIEPRHVVIVDQFIDRTRQRPSTFFGEGLVAHIAFADPICASLADPLARIAAQHATQAHVGGTYLCMEGPAFSTRAESNLYRSWGVDVIGMTNLQEAKLAREAEICYATLALVTDYDCWHDGEDDVNVAAVLEILRYNSELAARILHDTIESLPTESDCPCRHALEHAIITDRSVVTEEALERLRPIVGRYFDTETTG